MVKPTKLLKNKSFNANCFQQFALKLPHFHFIKAADQARHTVRPGVTGLVQVSGRHTLSWNEKFELDSHYVSNLSFWMDLKIIYKTILVILSFRKDISLEEKPLTGF